MSSCVDVVAAVKEIVLRGDTDMLTIINVSNHGSHLHSADLTSPWLSREIKIWLKLEHEHTVSLWEVADGFACLPARVSTWLKNGALTRYLQREHERIFYNNKFALAWSISHLTIYSMLRSLKLKDIAQGFSVVEAVHSRSITHGDLSGVLVGKDGQANLIDFGLSTLVLERRSQASVPTKCGGTAPYMAPERLAVDDEDDESTPVFSPKSDVDAMSGIK
ncbi:hypothetical protein BDR06DRAFT_1003093 [Suillus hirtellus]|nr:hypothetical protein BDR06DRAFT_1003093 [Suillus hirtellus]